jgi:hypothetical protein
MWRDYGVAKLRQIFWLVAGVGGVGKGILLFSGVSFFHFLAKLF